MIRTMYAAPPGPAGLPQDLKMRPPGPESADPETQEERKVDRGTERPVGTTVVREVNERTEVEKRANGSPPAVIRTEPNLQSRRRTVDTQPVPDPLQTIQAQPAQEIPLEISYRLAEDQTKGNPHPPKIPKIRVPVLPSRRGGPLQSRPIKIEAQAQARSVELQGERRRRARRPDLPSSAHRNGGPEGCTG